MLLNYIPTNNDIFKCNVFSKNIFYLPTTGIRPYNYTSEINYYNNIIKYTGWCFCSESFFTFPDAMTQWRDTLEYPYCDAVIYFLPYSF